MNETHIRLRQEMEQVLTPKRFTHTLGVAYTAAALAMCHKADVEAALTAGLLHDCAKCLPEEEQLRLCVEAGALAEDSHPVNPELLHAKAGAYLAKKQYGITDEDVLAAISSHTTGRPGMCLLEKIIYLADFIEPSRKPLRLMDQIRQTAFSDLDRALVLTIGNVLEYLRTTGKTIDPVSEETYQYYCKEDLYDKTKPGNI